MDENEKVPYNYPFSDIILFNVNRMLFECGVDG